jgi:chromosome segregation ATPase
LSFQKVSSKVEAKIAEIAKQRNIPKDYTKEITSRVIEILEQERKQIDEEREEIEGYIHCLEVNFDNLEKMIETQNTRYNELLGEKIKLENKICTLEGKKSKSHFC